MTREQFNLKSQSSSLLPIALALIITTFAASSTDIFGTPAGNILAFGLNILLVLGFVFTYRIAKLPKYPVLALILVYFLFVVNSTRRHLNIINLPPSFTPTSSALPVFLHVGEVVGYIVASFTLIFIIPQIFSKRTLFITFASVSTVSIIVGIPAYIVGDYIIFSVNINTYTSLEPFRYYGINIPALSSIWDDANAMSKIVVAGIFSTHYLYLKDRSRLWIGLLLLNLIGLFLANSKMAIAAIFVAYSCYAVYYYYSNYILRLYLAAGTVVGCVVFLAILLGLGTEPFVARIGLTSRVELWRAAVDTFSNHPIAGVGIYNVGGIIASYTMVGPLAPQNSYLRILVATGIVGGVSYISFILKLTFDFERIIETNRDMVLFSLFISFVLLQLTDTADPFGLNKNSIVFGSTIGYMFKDIYVL